MKRIVILLMLFLGIQAASSKDFANAKVGYYMYENGKCYASKAPEWAGKCVGVVISTTPNAEQLEMGYTHGTIVLLEDIPGLYQWWPENIEVAGVPSYSDSEEYPYAYTHKYLASRSEAAKACIDYPKIGENFSKCFIPTEGMWNLMLENIGLLNPKLNHDNTDNGRDARNTCAARLHYLIGGFKEDKDYWLARQWGSSSAYFGSISGTNNGSYRDSYNGRGRYTLDGKPGFVGDRTQRRRVRAMCYF